MYDIFYYFMLKVTLCFAFGVPENKIAGVGNIKIECNLIVTVIEMRAVIGETKRCGPLHRLSSSCCGGLRPSKKRSGYNILAQILVIYGDKK